MSLATIFFGREGMEEKGEEKREGGGGRTTQPLEILFNKLESNATFLF